MDYENDNEYGYMNDEDDVPMNLDMNSDIDEGEDDEESNDNDDDEKKEDDSDDDEEAHDDNDEEEVIEVNKELSEEKIIVPKDKRTTSPIMSKFEFAVAANEVIRQINDDKKIPECMEGDESLEDGNVIYIAIKSIFKSVMLPGQEPKTEEEIKRGASVVIERFDAKYIEEWELHELTYAGDEITEYGKSYYQ